MVEPVGHKLQHFRADSLLNGSVLLWVSSLTGLQQMVGGRDDAVGVVCQKE